MEGNRLTPAWLHNWQIPVSSLWCFSFEPLFFFASLIRGGLVSGSDGIINSLYKQLLCPLLRSWVSLCWELYALWEPALPLENFLQSAWSWESWGRQGVLKVHSQGHAARSQEANFTSSSDDQSAALCGGNTLSHLLQTSTRPALSACRQQ